jgi:hypothetical protein
LFQAWIEQKSPARVKGGSTATLCLLDVTNGVVAVGNLGDSHVVLGTEKSDNEGGFSAVCASFALFKMDMAN